MSYKCLYGWVISSLYPLFCFLLAGHGNLMCVIYLISMGGTIRIGMVPLLSPGAKGAGGFSFKGFIF